MTTDSRAIPRESDLARETAPGATPATPWRDLARALEIVVRVLPFAVSLRRDSRRWLRWGGPQPRSTAFHEQRARRLVREIATLGPAFVKLAQIFASRADLVPEPYLASLVVLTDRVPAVPWTGIRAALHIAWGVEPDSVLQALDREPLAAGSLGQVHRAQFHGRDVVVKVLRPGIDVVVRRDVRIAGRIVDWVYARFPHHHVHGFRIVLDEFAQHVGEEMDFVREGAQCARMRERFAEEPRLRIPYVEALLTRRNVLVMEYLPGTRIDALDERIRSGELSARALVETLIESYARMMLRDGVFHADPHPGNLLVDDAGRIVLLDFGMVVEVGLETRRALFHTIVAAIRRDAEGTAAGFAQLGMVAPGTSPETMHLLVAELLNIAYAETPMQDRARILADQIMREMFNWPIVLPGELVYFARTAALIEGIGGRYDRNFNGIRVASPVVLKLRTELFAALLGGEGATDRLVTMATALGFFAGGASAVVTKTWRELRATLSATFSNGDESPSERARITNTRKPPPVD